jgi:hypothetical protein
MLHCIDSAAGSIIFCVDLVGEEEDSLNLYRSLET